MAMIRFVEDIDVDYLRKNCQMIHYFGLGFIQLKIDQSHRLHFYTSELPAVVSQEDIHDHRYDFHSVIVKGYLDQELFTLMPGTTHRKDQETCKKDCAAPAVEPEYYMVKPTSQHIYRAGSEYFIDHQTFHRVWSSNCITSIHRGDYKKEFSNVVRPVDAKPVCPFSVTVEPDRLWEIVRSMANP
jgi:hypothetical protein